MSAATEVRHEVEVDTELSEIYLQQMQIDRRMGYHVDAIHRMTGSEKQERWFGREKITTWLRSVDEAIEAGQNGSIPPYEVRRFEQMVAERDEMSAQNEVLELRRIELESEYRADPWSRFFLVRDGHIHSSMDCSTCNRNGRATLFGWLPELSGLDEAAAVEAQGAWLCTVCFPSAPVEWTNQAEVDEAAKQAASCAGSGTRPESGDSSRRVNGYGRSTSWARCSECGEMQSVTSTGKFRKHKNKKAEG